jgi:integrase
MAIRKRKWTTGAGTPREAWVVDYVDQHKHRHIRTFDRRKDAEDYRSSVRVDVKAGVHTAPSRSITVAQAADDWLAFAKGEELERATLAYYRQHTAHILPLIGHHKLAALTKPGVHRFRDALLERMSRPLARKVLASLTAILKDAERRGNVAQNVASGVRIGQSKRDRAKLVVGTDIPTVDEIRSIVAAAHGRWRPILLTAIFTGLRASELRGLRWQDVDLRRGELHVRQRADRYDEIGKPKSKAGHRTVPITPMLANALRQWKLQCPPSRLNLAFPTGTGGVIHHGDLIRRGLIPTIVRAGVVDADGKAKYTGMHCLRHFYASRLINARADGRLELPAKVVQERLGHASIVMTLDTYSHLFPRGDDAGAEAEAEASLFKIETRSRA